MIRFLALVVLVGATVAGGMYVRKQLSNESHEIPFRTDKVTRGDLHINVRATGTVEPEENVDVGAQVVGRIAELGKDPRGKTDQAFADKNLDYGSPVEKGMLLVQIDPAIYKAQFDQANASLAQAEAHVLQAAAQVAQTSAEWDRAQLLKQLKIPNRSPTGDQSADTLPIKGISEADYILAKANADAAKADLEAAKASVLQQKAGLAMAETNLKYTTISAPIDGTVIRRSVNIGQTVVSSLNAPSLFLLARDLRKMVVWAAVNEADIAKVKSGTPVHFRVDALPQDTFHGTVTQVRLNASMTQNVVTYIVVISVDNSDLKLLPYLTADVYFEVEEHKDVMLVPNAALRYRPSPDQIAPAPESEATETPAEKGDAVSAGGAPGQGGQRGQGGGRGRHEAANVGKIWQIDPETEKLKAIEVKTGASDLAFTEITTDNLQEGDEIVVGEIHAAAPSGGEITNPLAPPSFRRNRNNPSSNQGQGKN